MAARRVMVADAGAGAGEDALDLEARGDVLGQLVLGDVGHQAAEVDDGAHARLGAGVGHRLGRLPVAGGEVGAAHPVDEVEHGVDALDRGVDGVGVEHVHPHELDLVGPPAAAGLVEVGDRGPHRRGRRAAASGSAGCRRSRGAGDEDGRGAAGGAPAGRRRVLACAQPRSRSGRQACRRSTFDSGAGGRAGGRSGADVRRASCSSFLGARRSWIQYQSRVTSDGTEDRADDAARLAGRGRHRRGS